MASRSPVILLTLDFVVAISALRISGSYLELDDEPDSTRAKQTLHLAALPPSPSPLPAPPGIKASHHSLHTWLPWAFYPFARISSHLLHLQRHLAQLKEKTLHKGLL